MKIAIVHDWLVTYAGAERVLEQMLQCFPEAALFSVVDFIPQTQRHFLLNKKSSTTFIQRIPLADRKYRQYLPLMPWAVERLNLSSYDLILSSSHAVAKGVKKTNGQIHLSYIHTPMRYVWDLREEYLCAAGLNHGIKGRIANWLLGCIQKWDFKNTERVDGLMANSKYIADRIKANYGRDARVIYPPVDIESFLLCEDKETFYFTASRFVPYKKIDLIVEAFSRLPDKKLVVIGVGPDWKKVKLKASENVTLMGYQHSDVLKYYMQRAKAFLFAAEEDFGITVVEAQACGTPVIAFGKGGALETVKGLEQDKPTGVFFLEQTIEGLIGGIKKFEENKNKILPKNCRENALKFGVERFRKEFMTFVEEYRR